MQRKTAVYTIAAGVILALGVRVPHASGTPARHAHEAGHADRVTACGVLKIVQLGRDPEVLQQARRSHVVLAERMYRVAGPDGERPVCQPCITRCPFRWHDEDEEAVEAMAARAAWLLRLAWNVHYGRSVLASTICPLMQ